MTNLSLLSNLIERYNRLAYTHNYIFGITYKGNVYAIIATNKVLPYILTLDKASSKNGGGYSLRFNPTNEQKVLLLSLGAELICSKDFFEKTVAASPYNRGEIFEKLCTENAGQTWKKDNTPFTEDGDLTVNGTAYQIKFEKASFISEKVLMGLER